MEYGKTKGRKRIHNTKGYVKGNVFVCSRLANKAKGELTILELRLFAENILKIHSL